MKKLFLCLVNLSLMISLAGCFNISEELWHNSDNSGRYMDTIVFSENYLSQYGDMVAFLADPYLIAEMNGLTEESLVGSNISSGKLDAVSDYENRTVTVTRDIEIINMVEGLKGSEVGETVDFTIEDIGDGVFLYHNLITFDLRSSGVEEVTDEIRELAHQETEGMTYSVTVHATDFLIGDAFAQFDKDEQTITWERPMEDVILELDGWEIWAEYRVEKQGFFEELFSGKDNSTDSVGVESALDVDSTSSQESSNVNWLAILTFSIFFLALVIMISVIVIVAVLKKKKEGPSAE